MHPHHHQLLQKPRSGVRIHQAGKPLEGEGADVELEAVRATSALAHLWKRDDFGLKVTGRVL